MCMASTGTITEARLQALGGAEFLEQGGLDQDQAGEALQVGLGRARAFALQLLAEFGDDPVVSQRACAACRGGDSPEGAHFRVE